MTRLFRVWGLVLLAVALSGNSQSSTAPDVLWTRIFGNPRTPELARDVQQTTDGGYILVGAGEKGDFGSSVRQTPDGGYILAGITTVGFGRPSPKEGYTPIVNTYVVKTDGAGNLPPTPPASGCVGDANHNGIGDIVDIQTTAAQSGCWVYLPLVVANWRQPWPPHAVQQSAPVVIGSPATPCTPRESAPPYRPL